MPEDRVTRAILDCGKVARRPEGFAGAFPAILSRQVDERV
jgi:hypothetical protein